MPNCALHYMECKAECGLKKKIQEGYVHFQETKEKKWKE